MTLFLSDLHLGRGSSTESEAAERDVIALLRSYEDLVEAEGGGLYLVGDVFDQFMEYKHLVPKGFIRLQGLFADWTDRGIPITYVIGNRDAWHIDFFEREMGIRVIGGALDDRAEGLRIHLAHGDGLVPHEWFYNRIRSAMHNKHVARAYRALMPGDSGFALARWVVRHFSTDGASQERTVDALRGYAESVLSGSETDLVVLGHCHRAACIHMVGGTYLNAGYWFADRTFASVGASGPAVYRWSGERAEPLMELESANESVHIS